VSRRKNIPSGGEERGGGEGKEVGTEGKGSSLDEKTDTGEKRERIRDPRGRPINGRKGGD